MRRHLSLFEDDDDFFSMGRINRMMNEMMRFDIGGFDMDSFDEDKLEGNFVCQSFTQKTVIGPDGRPIVEKTVKNKQQRIDRNGNKIGESQEIYKHSKGIKRMVKQRTLNDKKVKIFREKNKDQFK